MRKTGMILDEVSIKAIFESLSLLATFDWIQQFWGSSFILPVCTIRDRDLPILDYDLDIPSW